MEVVVKSREQKLRKLYLYRTSVCKETLDEAPDAYKDTEEILELIKPTCELLFFIKPVINLKSVSGE